jgi:hypothetical protein
MSASLYAIQFVGGPSDGLVLRDPHFNLRDKLQMRASPAVVRCGQTRCYELVGYWSAGYLLTSRHHTIEGGHATISLRYDFLGYELLKTKAEREPRRRLAPIWWTGLGNWFSRIPRGFARWMMEPIDGPLEERSKESSFSQRA